MTSKESLWQKSLGWLADWQVIPVGFLALFLVFPTHFPSKLVTLALLAIPCLWLLHRLARGRFFTATPVDLPILILLTTLIVGVWAAALPDLALLQVIKYVIAVALFYAVVNTLTTNRKVEGTGWLVIAGTTLVAGASLLGTAWGGGSKFLPVDLAGQMPHAIDAFWNPAGFNPNIVAGILVMLAPITAAYAWGARTWSLRLLLALLFGGQAFVLLLTQSRGALLSFIPALLVVAIARDRRWAWAVPLLIVVVVLGVAVYGLQPSLDLIMQGAGDSALASGQGRLELFSRGFYMLQDFPFTGVGLGMFPRVLPLLYPLFSVGPDTDIPHVHNVYLQMGIDHGFPGLIAFLAFVILLGMMGLQSIRHSRGQPWEPLAIGLLAGLTAFLLHGLTDAMSFLPRPHIIVWGYWGLAVALWRLATARPPADQG